MRHRFPLSLVAISLLLVGATVAQDATPAAAPADPLLRALLGDSPEQDSTAPRRATAPIPPVADPLLLPPAPPTPDEPHGLWLLSDGPATAPTIPDEPAPPPTGGWLLTQDGTGRAVYGQGGTTGNGFSFYDGIADARDYTTWNTNSNQVDLRVSVEGGGITVHRNGRPVPDDQIEQHGSTLRVHDGTGRLLVTIDVAGDGRVTIPPGWSFRGPANWATQAQSKNVIGIRTGSIEAALAQHLGLGDGEGILISEAVPGHPAAAAGLRAHDVIVAIDGRRPATLDLLKNTLQTKEAGAHITLTVVRAGNTLEIRSEITQISAPVGANTLPSGAYALSLGDYAGVLTEEGNVPAPTLLWRRSGNVLLGSEDGTAVLPPSARTLGSAPALGLTGGGGAGRVVAVPRLPGGLAAGQVVSPGASNNFGGQVVGPDGNPIAGALVAPGAGGVVDLSRGRIAAPVIGDGFRRAGPGGDRLETIEKRLEKLEELLEKLLEQKSKDRQPRAEAPRRTQNIDGRVVAVIDGLVILSVGSDDGVASGDEFVVYRGEQFIGKVRVSSVTSEQSEATVLFTHNNLGIEQGQSATTRLKSLTTPWEGDDTVGATGTGG